MQTPSQHHHPNISSSDVTVIPTKAATRGRWCRVFSRALLAAAGLCALPVMAETTVYVLTTDGKLATAPVASPAAVSAPVTITGVTMGETLVGIDVRPQNQLLYALGVNAVTDTATLYCVSPVTGVAAVVGTAGSIAYTTDGVTPVDLPDPVMIGWDIDFNPAVDRLRIVAGSLNCRVNPNNGTAVDGNNGGMAAVTGTNPDGAINGPTMTVSATAYVNSQPNNGNITTQYTLDGNTDSLYIQVPPNNGTQTGALFVTLGGSTLDFTSTVGFDIPPGVNTAMSNTPVTSGSGFALLTVGGTGGLYSINLVTGQATLIGNLSGRSLAIRQELGAVITMTADGTSLVRFSTTTPGTTTTQAITGLTAGEALVGIDTRPQTGQMYALGINATLNNGTIYLLDPQGGQLTAVGTPGQIAYVQADGVTPVDLPDPVMTGYGFDFNPTVDRIRIVSGSGLNFRANPNNGAPVDGNTMNPGTNPDGNINGTSMGVDATAYTNSFGQPLMGGVTTQYTIDSVTNALNIQNPPNNGTQTIGLPVTLNGNPLDFTATNGFDITGAVAVATSNSAAKGLGWLVATVGGATGLYTLDLQTGETVSFGAIGTGTTPLAGLSVATTPSLRVEFPANTPIYDNLATIDFGNVQVGNAGAETVTIRNTGTQALVYTAAVDMGAPFAINDGANGTILPGGTGTISVIYTPPGNGTFNGTLRILNNDSAVASFDIALTGTSIVPLGDDAVAVTGGDTRIFVLANDGVGSMATITAVSDSSITIGPDGRSLIIPSGFTGTFTYTVTEGAFIGMGTVTVTAGTPASSPTVFNGLLRDDGDEIVGFASVKISATGVATVQISAGTAKVKAKITLDSGTNTGVAFTSLGYVVLTKNLDGTADLSLDALGGDISGTLGAAASTGPGPLAKLNFSLASIDAAFPGGGIATATISTKGDVKITGTLPDGIAFSATSALRDNKTIAFYTVVTKGAKPPAFLGGELLLADLAATDFTGELAWTKLPQLPGAKGVHLSGVDTTLVALGSLYDDGTVNLNQAGTLVLSGGNLAATETNPVTITGGIPSVAGSLTAWNKVNFKNGTFKVSVTVPGLTKPSKGKGIYLSKNFSAFGFFPGTSVGGKIQLTIP